MTNCGRKCIIIYELNIGIRNTVGESLATFYGVADKFEAAAAEYRSGLVYGAEKPEEAPLVYALVTKDGVERY